MYEIQAGIDTVCYYHALTPKQKSKIIAKLCELPRFRIKGDYWQESRSYQSDCFADQGIKLFISRISDTPWGLKIVVHPMLVQGETDRSVLYRPSCKKDYKALVKAVDKLLARADIPCSVDAMTLYRVDVTTNLIFRKPTPVNAYIRILKKGRLLPNYCLDWFREYEEKAQNCKRANEHSYKQKCRSAAFFVYDKTAQLEMIEKFPKALIGKHVLRLEAQLRRKGMKKWLSGKKLESNWEIIRELNKNAKHIVQWYLKRTQPKCERYVRYKDAVQMITDLTCKRNMRERMLYLLRKTSDSRDLTIALSKLKDKFDLTSGQVDNVLKKFRKLGISPITLANSSDLEELPPILR